MSATYAAGRLDIASLHTAYASGELTPTTLIEQLYARMEQEAAPAVWITRVDKQAALARASELGSYSPAALPLYGIPFAVKDNVDVAGLPTTAACPVYAYLPEASASAVQSLLDAGAICLGKTNLDQFATGLVGSRSPYGSCVNVFHPAYLSGGSSSGSAVAVAAHFVSFSLGTDTAGSGRVPAALNNIVGLKPSVGLFSNDGMVPACASLDCLSVFAGCVADAISVRSVILGKPALPIPRPAAFRFGVPSPLEFFGDAASQAGFERALARLRELGGEPVPIDYTPFSQLGDMLYGPFVVERLLGVGDFIQEHQRDVLPVTRDIILSGKKFSASDAFVAFRRVQALRAACLGALASVDLFVTPTVPRHFLRSEDEAEPRTVNDALGIYTRFVNFLGCPVLSVPQELRADGLPFGISLLALPGQDARLDALGALLHELSGAGMGKLRQAPPQSADAQVRPPPVEARVAVVGAHMRGLALNQQLLDVRARYVATVRTAPKYKLYVLPNTKPERPGLVQVPEGGSSIELELWDLSWHGLGELMARVPAPLTIGTLEVDDGERVKGFLCEGYAVIDARDISTFGGYRAYASSK
ncbi:MAG: Allophanate hydrolase [Myxococcaceae bacterium]|nr:Allophanate hydrolase [Myxococcaceae bacterium]